MRVHRHPISCSLLIASLALAIIGCGPDDPAGVDAGIADLRAVDGLRRDAAGWPAGPKRLSETGLYADLAARKLAPGVIPFTPRWELWSDGAGKGRWLLLPTGAKIDTAAMDEWVFPVGTKAWKELGVGGRAVETRLLEKVRAGEGSEAWWQVAYLWRADGSDADAVPDGAPSALGTDHDVPAQDDCDACHGNVRDVLIGVSALQLAAPGMNGEPSLSRRLASEGRLTVAPSRDYAVPGAGDVQAALGYLHGNCAHCHNPRAFFAREVPLGLGVTTTSATPEDTAAYRSAIGQRARHLMPGGIATIVVPGAPEQSQLWLRMGHRADGWEMPPACTDKIDMDGMAAVRRWIAGLR